MLKAEKPSMSRNSLESRLFQFKDQALLKYQIQSDWGQCFVLFGNVFSWNRNVKNLIGNVKPSEEKNAMDLVAMSSEEKNEEIKLVEHLPDF